MAPSWTNKHYSGCHRIMSSFFAKYTNMRDLITMEGHIRQEKDMEWDNPIISLLWEKFSSPFVTAMSAICTLEFRLCQLHCTTTYKDSWYHTRRRGIRCRFAIASYQEIILPRIVIVQSFEGYTLT